jgi:hypothetical protein
MSTHRAEVVHRAREETVADIYRYLPHHRTEEMITGQLHGPIKVADQLPRGSVIQRFNTRAGLLITVVVGTMWCGYIFAIIAFISLPSAIKSHNLTVLIAWVSSNFLQLILLPIIIVGQNIQAQASDKRAEATYKDADAILHEAVKIQEHLLAQDKILDEMISKLEPKAS